VVSIIRELPLDVSLICARRKSPIQSVDFSTEQTFETTKEETRGVHKQPPLADMRLVRAKSDQNLVGLSAQPILFEDSSALNHRKSHSLEPLDRFTMWETDVILLELERGDKGLGFSILDYPVCIRFIRI